MVVVKQILPDEAQFQPLCGSPCQLRVDSRNGGNFVGRHSTDKVCGAIPSQTVRQLHMRPQLSLMLWVPKFREGNAVLTGWFQMQIGFQKRIARTQSPTTRQFHVGGNFYASRRAIQFILEYDWNQEVSWSWTRHKNRQRRLRRNQVRVSIVKRREINGEACAGLRPESCFVGQNVFGLDSRVSK